MNTTPEREILFKGKRKDTGEWVEGGIFKKPDGRIFIICDIWNNDEVCDYCEYIVESYEVAPESVGQYVGLEDKNGKKIFEKDIFNNGDPKILYVVEWIDCGLRGRQIKNKSYIGFWHWHDNIEIIGNLTDNPELMK